MKDGRTTDGRDRDLCVMEMRLPVIETISEPFCICFLLPHEPSEAGQLHKEIELANSFEGSWVWCQPQPSSDETLLTHITVLWGRGQ